MCNRVLGAALLFLALVLPHSPARAQTPSWQAAAASGTTVLSSGSLTLAPDAAPAAPVYGSYARFGLFDRQPESIPAARQLRVSWQASVPAAAAVRIDVRVQGRGRWSDWTLDVADGALVTFDRVGTLAQVRVVLLANAAAPEVHSVQLTPQPLGAAAISAFEDTVAPTYHIRATRMGLVGDRTANGHIIQPNDWFVSLPSFRSLSSKGGSEYMARLSYNGRSVVVPVWEVGPWNIHDDYWNVERERFADLPVGWPEDHAAYYDGYNGGWAEKGRVRFPTAADVGDGAWLALGIPFNEEQEAIDITFLWQGSDPGPNPTPIEPGQRTAAPPVVEVPAGAIQVDTPDAGFWRTDVPWYTFGCGTGGSALWTFSTSDAGSATNTGAWQAEVSGDYDVSVFVPRCMNGKADTRSAHYVVEHADGSTPITVNQAEHAGEWVSLGRYHFDGAGKVILSDHTDDTWKSVWFDAVRWSP